MSLVGPRVRWCGTPPIDPSSDRMPPDQRLADFIVIGAHKAGTTSLHHYFDQHPGVFMTVLKEPNFFSFDPTNPVHMGGASHQYRVRSLAEYAALFAEAPATAKTGEVSPSYLFSPQAPRRIRDTVPNGKLIVSLRDPVDRTYSAFQMALRTGKAAGTAFDLDPSRDMWFRGGLYSAPLRSYLEHFSAERFRVILFDDLVRDPAAVMRDLFEYVGVDPGFALDTSYRFNPGGVPDNRVLHRGLNALKRWPWLREVAPKRLRHAVRTVRDRNLKRADPLPGELRSRWVSHFREDVLRTQDIIGRDLTHWLRIE